MLIGSERKLIDQLGSLGWVGSNRMNVTTSQSINFSEGYIRIASSDEALLLYNNPDSFIFFLMIFSAELGLKLLVAPAQIMSSV